MSKINPIDRKEWGGWKIVSDMLDNPDEHEIYPTSKCYQKLYEFVCEREKAVLDEVLGKIKKEFRILKNHTVEDEFQDGYRIALENLEKEIEQMKEKDNE